MHLNVFTCLPLQILLRPVHIIPLWAKLLTQLPLPIWYLSVELLARREQYRDFRSSSDGYGREGPATIFSFLWLNGWSLLRDLLILVVPMITVVVYNITGKIGKYRGMRLLFFWVISFLVDHVHERADFFKHLGWNMVDILIAIFTGWSLSSTQLVDYETKEEVLDPETTLFLVSNSRSLMLPISIWFFLVTIRMLRYLYIFPAISVPWATFTRSFTEISSYLIVFCVIIAAFAILYMVNFGGELQSFSGIWHTYQSLLPFLFRQLPQEDSTAHALSAVINFFFGFVGEWTSSTVLVACLERKGFVSDTAFYLVLCDDMQSPSLLPISSWPS